MDEIAEIRALLSYYDEGIATRRETLLKIADVAYRAGETPCAGSPELDGLFDSAIRAGNKAFGHEEG